MEKQNNFDLDSFISNIEITSLNGSDLAYLGDAYYELFIRSYLLSKGITNPHELHEKCTNYVNGKAHTKIMKILYNSLSETEERIYKRGRNYTYKHRPKGLKLSEYLMSSGFEALIGYLYVSKQNDRLEEILATSIRIIENESE